MEVFSFALMFAPPFSFSQEINNLELPSEQEDEHHAGEGYGQLGFIAIDQPEIARNGWNRKFFLELTCRF